VRRNRRGRQPAPPPPPDGLIWDLDEYVTHREFARPHVDEMRAFDSLPALVRRELRDTGQSALAYLEWQKGNRRPLRFEDLF
jgi:hypothetical protein